MSLNLHDIVRSAINANYQDDEFNLFRSLGQKNINGIIKSYYQPAEKIKGNFQSEGDSALSHANLAGENTIIRKLYLYATDNKKDRPFGIYRPLSRSGDYVVDKYGMYWLITAVLEDFSDAGWMSVRCTFQETIPDIEISEDTAEDGENGTQEGA